MTKLTKEELTPFCKKENETLTSFLNEYYSNIYLIQEFKNNSTNSKSSIDNLLRKGNSQASYIVLEINSNISLGTLSEAIKDRVGRSNIKGLTIIRDSHDATFYKEQICKNDFIIKQEDFK